MLFLLVRVPELYCFHYPCPNDIKTNQVPISPNLVPSHRTCWVQVRRMVPIRSPPYILMEFVSCVEWAAFMVLSQQILFSSSRLYFASSLRFDPSDIGLSVTESLPVGTRIIDGLFQGLAARASGFSIVSISALAPGVQLG